MESWFVTNDLEKKAQPHHPLGRLCLQIPNLFLFASKLIHYLWWQHILLSKFPRLSNVQAILMKNIIHQCFTGYGSSPFKLSDKINDYRKKFLQAEWIVNVYLHFDKTFGYSWLLIKSEYVFTSSKVSIKVKEQGAK